MELSCVNCLCRRCKNALNEKKCPDVQCTDCQREVEFCTEFIENYGIDKMPVFRYN